MKEWNARMRMNKRPRLKGCLFGLLILVILAFSPLAQAQPGISREDDIVSPLYGVGGFIFSPVILPKKEMNPTSSWKDAAECGVDTHSIESALIEQAKESGMPIPGNDADALRSDIFRVTVTPEVTTLRVGGVTCVSWVALKAESSHTVQLPPIQQAKIVTITYFSKGGLLITPSPDHEVAVEASFRQLMTKLIAQWENDNPQITPANNAIPHIGGQ